MRRLCPVPSVPPHRSSERASRGWALERSATRRHCYRWVSVHLKVVLVVVLCVCDAVLFERKTALLLIVVMCVVDVGVNDMVMISFFIIIIIF